MAICEWCNREMSDHVSCTVTEFHLDGVPYALEPNRTRHDCGDCGTPPGGHHHPGCDTAPCPLCRKPMFTCGQRFDEDGPDPDEDPLDDGPTWPPGVVPISATTRNGFRPGGPRWAPV